MVKATFSLDEATMAEIRRTADRLRRPQSHVVRDAVAEYAARADRLSEGERRRLLDVLAGLRRQRPARTAAAVNTELAAIRSARRAGGRRHRA
jgi:predicted transcriptional regulator